MSESRVPVVAIAVALVAVGASAWWWMRPAGKAPEPAPITAPQPQASTPVVPEPARPPEKDVKPQQPTKGKLLYAGGHEMPALNGVTQDIKLDWEGPWSPVARMIKDNGWEWYIHEDGSHSTTRMIEMNGVPQAMALRAK